MKKALKAGGLRLITGIVLIALGRPPESFATDFAAPKSYSVGTSPAFIITGDLNGDGKPDLAVANTGSNDVSVLLDNGDGTFKTAVNSPAGTSPQKMAADDFNGDGKLDLVVINEGDGANVNGAVFLLLGKGDGTFQAPVGVAADKFPSSIAVVDANEDQKPDLLLGDGFGGGLTLLLGKGDGTFQPAATIPQVGGLSVSAMAVGDFNGDKHLDVVVADVVSTGTNTSTIPLYLLEGKGDGTFQSASLVTTLGVGGSGNVLVKVFNPRLVSVDVNADGKLDLVVRYGKHITTNPPCGITKCNSDLVFALLDNGDGTFTAPNPPFSISPFPTAGNLTTADLNDDSKVDLLISAFSLVAPLWLGHGDGTFPVAETLPMSVTGFLAASDLNSDGLPDVIVTDPGNNAVVVSLNTSPTSGADLALRLFGPSATAVVGGGDLSYTVRVTNEGPQDASGVSLKETLSAGLKFVSAQPSVGTCTGTTIITCDLGAMTDVSTATVSFTVTPIAAGVLTDALQVSGATADGNTKNNSASFTVNVTLPADISVTGSASKTAATVGDKVAYTIQVSNAGPGDAANVTLSDAISDSGLTLSSVTVSQGSCTPTAGNLSCSFGTLAKGGKINVSFALTMTSAEIVTNSVSINSDTPDLNTADNGATLTVAVDAANLSITEGVSTNTVLTGKSVNYTITVTNKGPARATNVAVFDGFQGTATASPTAATPSQGTCTPFDANAQTMNCSIGTLAPNASATITFSATASIPATATNGGTLSNNATVQSSQPDPDTSDNSVSTSVAVSLPLDFSIYVPATSLTLSRGEQETETLTFPAQGGLATNIDLKCSVSGPSPMPTCALSPASVAPGGSSTLTISAASLSAFATDAPLLEGHGTRRGTGVCAVWLPFSMLGLIFAGLRDKRLRGRWVLSVVLGLVASVAAACGGGGTPLRPQNYSVTVTATSGAVQHTTTISVTVQ